MRIATLSKADSTGGGASKVAEELSDAYRGMGLDAVHFCADPRKGLPDGRRLLYGGGGASTLVRQGHRVARRIGLAESVPLEAAAVLRTVRPVTWDVAHVHDTTTALSPVTLGLVARRVPTVWTLHDASPFTGGCIQPMDCTRFRTGCGKCPQNGTWPLNGTLDATRMHSALRRRLHRSGLVRTVSPSRWLAEMAFSSGMLSRAPDVIPNPIDTDTYAPPTDKAALRRAKGVPEDRLVLLMSAGHASDPRKGVRHAIEVVQGVADLNPYVLLVGGVDPSLAPLLQGLDRLAVGFVANSAELASWYACADAFVYGASIDNQPLTVLETQACGIPTFGFAVGGTPELVEEGHNGVLVPHGDVSAVSAAIARAVVQGSLGEMGMAGRDFVRASFSVGTVASRYLDLYREIVAENKGLGEAA